MLCSRTARDWDVAGIVFPVEAKIDQVGRIVLPKALRDRLGMSPGTVVDVSEYGDGLHIAHRGRSARLVRRDGVLVAVSDHEFGDDDVFTLTDSIRR